MKLIDKSTKFNENSLDFEDNKILNYIENKKYETENINNLIEREDIELYNVFSSFNENILCWYNFKFNSEILIIGKHYGELLEFLSKNCKELTVLEESLARGNAMAQRYNKLNNLNIYVENIENNTLDKKFDYVIIFDDINIIKYVKNLKKEDGHILLITDNRFGVQYIAGEKRKNNRIFETIYNSKVIKSKYEIEKFLQEEGLYNYKFFYPLPNSKITNVIYSDEYLPTYTDTKLLNLNLYSSGSIIINDELKFLKEFTKNNLFKEFTNTYFIDICDLEKNKVRFVSYNNSRKKEYRLITKIYDNFVEKSYIDETSKKHIYNIKNNIKDLVNMGFNVIDKYEDDKIISEFQDCLKLDEIIVKKIELLKFNDVYEIISNWFEYIKQNYSSKKIYIDMVFENTFYKDGEYYFFDQEWVIDQNENNIDLNFILYRAINNIYIYNSISHLLAPEEIFKYFGILDEIEKFKKIEKEFQLKIQSDEIKEVQEISRKKCIDIDEFSLLKGKIIDFELEDKRKAEYIQALEEDNKNKQEYISALEKKIKNKKLFLRR